ncbi:hypothetical protein [Saccharothrix sp. ST-888]|uniref:hypothetical protein n=1 Tax=Saccharothrix sp. ST-888 TaxID=1427391 RepID=UPI0005EC0C0A|nr:hypothetical protein [Saccharothrix sp. ST-888]KJK56673.1 hypothetical protein UK12_21155 [Saccharothrix sp. ST-888]
MSWTIVAAVLLATAGLLVLGVLACRLWLDVRALAREVDTASRALAAAATELAGEPLRMPEAMTQPADRQPVGRQS